MQTAFLHGEITEELYVNQQEVFIADGNESLVCNLHKELYGLNNHPDCGTSHFTFLLPNPGR